MFNQRLLAKNIKTLRKANKLTQEELAKELGVFRHSVNLWETQKILPSLTNVILLCQYFEVPIDKLLFAEIEVQLQ